MIIFTDENLPSKLAQGLNLLESANTDAFDVHSIKDYFKKGSKDEEWIPEVGKLSATVITQDHNIHRQQMQRGLYRKHKVGLIVFKHQVRMDIVIGKWLKTLLSTGNK